MVLSPFSTRKAPLWFLILESQKGERWHRRLTGTIPVYPSHLSIHDSLSRVLSATLPIGEVLTNTYNARGLFEASSSISSTYVSSTSYTATGGIDEQALGNGVRIAEGRKNG